MQKATESTRLTYHSMLAGCDDTEGKATGPLCIAAPTSLPPVKPHQNRITLMIFPGISKTNMVWG